MGVFQWLLIDWKLKALSLGLTVLLLGAVSFAESPVQTVSVNAHISYDNTPRTGLVLNNPPATTKATITGTSAQIRTAVITADIDLSKLPKGTAIAVTPVATNTGSDAKVTSVSPVTLDMEDLLPKALDIDVRASAAQGWQITSAQPVCGSPPTECQVTVIGPAALLKDLSAYVTVDSPVSANTREQLATLIKFEKGGNAFDLGSVTTIPAVTWSPQTVTAIVAGQTGHSDDSGRPGRRAALGAATGRLPRHGDRHQPAADHDQRRSRCRGRNPVDHPAGGIAGLVHVRPHVQRADPGRRLADPHVDHHRPDHLQDRARTPLSAPPPRPTRQANPGPPRE